MSRPTAFHVNADRGASDLTKPNPEKHALCFHQIEDSTPPLARRRADIDAD